jgi:hypothetical protein
MIEKNNKEPYINIWFGNFYKPAFDDKNFIEKNIKLIKKLGFNSIMLDSKAWQDFRDRFNGLPASQYVEMQEFMQKVAKENNISHQFLALYLNGDNLYPYIRFSPPIYGESIITAKGIDGKWYRYWSDKAKQSMTEHVSGLMKMYSKNYTTVEINGEEKLPLCSMWDPIVAPSFDDDGKQRYLNWLKKQYKNNIEFFNKAYGTSFSDFNALTKEDYWFECAYPDKKTYSLESLKKMLPECIMWTDNIKWKIEELCLYFEDMEKRLHHINKKFYLCPNMAQWGYFLNIDGSMLSNVGFSNLWDTAMRGIDIYKLSKYVDSCHFITVPVTPFGDADAYVVSCQHSMMRVMNSNKGFIGGIYWGRFLYNNIYETLTPCEIVGSIVASGAKAYSSYGICGLDDGGLLDRMDDYFLSSLETANNWMKKIVPLIKDKKGPKIAILFPSAMAAFEPMYIEGNKERRMDLLGWYKSCCDSGYQADIIDIDSINNEILKNYKILIIPANDCYSLQTNKKAEFELESVNTIALKYKI